MDKLAMIKSQFSSVVVISCMFEIYRLAPPMDQKCKWEMVGKGAATLYDSLVRSLAIALYIGQS